MPQICMIRRSSLYRMSSSSQNAKKDSSGTQSSSRIIPSTSCSKNQSIDVETPLSAPRWLSRNKVFTSQGQSTCPAIARAASHNCPSAGVSGPSAAIYNRGGFARRIRSKTCCVDSGLSKIMNRTGLSKPSGLNVRYPQANKNGKIRTYCPMTTIVEGQDIYHWLAQRAVRIRNGTGSIPYYGSNSRSFCTSRRPSQPRMTAPHTDPQNG